ncbi:hypothetical protein [uncultured Sphingobacterium sp.]|jgi:hypothetical protein
MKFKILQIFLCLILLIGCNRNDSDLAVQENGIVESFKVQSSSRVDKEINYTPDWSAKQEYNGEIYVPLKADKEIFPIIDGNKQLSINNDIWLKATYKEDNWKFTILKVLPNDDSDKFKSGIVVYEDYKNGTLSWRI